MLRPRRLVNNAAPSPAVVTQRLCDLLLSFPSAASSGVQWHTLARRYEARHSARLDLSALGYSSALTAATALLWDVLRLVDAEDTDNPVVAAEDAVVLVPRPGQLGSWPSLYQTLQKIVLSHGTPEKLADACNGCEVSRGLMLSQLKPLLQLHWHTNFEEGSLGYLSDEGTWVRVKKMKHLVQAVLRWRDQRVAWQAAVGGRPTPVDDAIAHRMDLVPCKKYNDLVLRCTHQTQAVPLPTHTPGASSAPLSRRPGCCNVEGCEAPRASDEERRLEELQQLRAENAQLRSNNERLLQCHRAEALLATPSKLGGPPLAPLQPPAMVLDHPFEPPPERWQQMDGSFWVPFLGSPVSSTAAPSEWGFASTSPGTPLSMASPFLASSSGAPSEFAWPDSGPATPMSAPLERPVGVWSSPWADAGVCQASSFAQTFVPASGSLAPPQQPSGAAAPCSLMPVWFPSHALSGLMPSRFLGDRGVIPNGIVQQARALFEPEPAPPLPPQVAAESTAWV